jgi:hypothetical protein
MELRSAIENATVDLSGYQAHGLAKGSPADQLSALDRLLTKGPEVDQIFHSGPLRPSAEMRSTGVLNTRTDAPFVLVSEKGKGFGGPVKTVLLNDTTAHLQPYLTKKYPGVRFLKPSEIDALGSSRVKGPGTAKAAPTESASIDGPSPHAPLDPQSPRAIEASEKAAASPVRAEVPWPNETRESLREKADAWIRRQRGEGVRFDVPAIDRKVGISMDGRKKMLRARAMDVRLVPLIPDLLRSSSTWRARSGRATPTRPSTAWSRVWSRARGTSTSGW